MKTTEKEAETPKTAHKQTEEELLKERIAKAQEARASLAKSREQKRETVEDLAKKAEAEEIAFADERAIDQAESELGERGLKFATVATPLGVVVLRRSNPLKYKKFQDVGKYTTVAFEELIRPCVHYPTLSKFDAILTEFPGILAKSADAIAELANGTRKESEGKS